MDADEMVADDRDRVRAAITPSAGGALPGVHARRNRRIRSHVAAVCLAAAGLLAGCTNSIEGVLSGSPTKPVIALDPCEKSWLTWSKLTVTDLKSGDVKWVVASNGGSVPMAVVTYGSLPPGSTEWTAAAPIRGDEELQWLFEAPGSQPVSQTFDLVDLKPGRAIHTDGSTESIEKWLARCRD